MLRELDTPELAELRKLQQLKDDQGELASFRRVFSRFFEIRVSTVSSIYMGMWPSIDQCCGKPQEAFLDRLKLLIVQSLERLGL